MSLRFVYLLLNPIWKWGVALPVEIAGVVFFLRPDLEPINVAWYWYVIVGLVFWAIGTAWEASKKTADIEPEGGKIAKVTAKSTGQTGGNNLAQQATTINNQWGVPDVKPVLDLASEPPVPQISIPALKPPSLEGVSLSKQRLPENQFGYEKEVRLIVHNGTGIALTRCCVYLREISSRKQSSNKKPWLAEDLPFAKPFLWKDQVIDIGIALCMGADIAPWHNASFTIAEVNSRLVHPYQGDKYYEHSFVFTLCDDILTNALTSGFDYRLLIHLVPSHVLNPINQVRYYVYLDAFKHAGSWRLSGLERILE